MGEPSKPGRPRRGPPGQCDICGLSTGQAMGFLIDCLLHDCTACVQCCSLVGGPYAEPCRDCSWGKQFWRGGRPPSRPLEAEDALLTYA